MGELLLGRNARRHDPDPHLEWADRENSDPLADIRSAMELINKRDIKMLAEQSKQIEAVNAWWLELTTEERKNFMKYFKRCPRCAIAPLLKDGSCLVCVIPEAKS